MCTVPGGHNVVGSVEGAVEGDFRTFSGTEEGLLVGDWDDVAVDWVGNRVGTTVGVGNRVGVTVGRVEGFADGYREGFDVGRLQGMVWVTIEDIVGTPDGWFNRIAIDVIVGTDGPDDRRFATADVGFSVGAGIGTVREVIEGYDVGSCEGGIAGTAAGKKVERWEAPGVGSVVGIAFKVGDSEASAKGKITWTSCRRGVSREMGRTMLSCRGTLKQIVLDLNMCGKIQRLSLRQNRYSCNMNQNGLIADWARRKRSAYRQQQWQNRWRSCWDHNFLSVINQ